MVRDDQKTHLVATNLCNRGACKSHRVGIQTTVGLIEDRKLGRKHRHRQDLSPLHLSTGEPIVDITASKIRIDLQLLHLGLELFAELAHRYQVLTLLTVRTPDVRRRMTKKVCRLDARNRHRPLKRHEDSSARTLVGLHLRKIRIVELDRTLGDLVVRVTGDGQPKGALARSVRTHQCMGLAEFNDQVHAAQDRLVIDRNVQVFNLQYMAHSSSLFKFLWV